MDLTSLWKMLAELARYGFVGIVANSSGYLIYLLVTSLGVDPIVAMTVLYAVGATIGFIGNRKWTFKYTGGISANFLRYACAHLIGYGIDFSMLYYFSEKLSYPHQLVQGAAVIVVAAYLFLIFKYWVFANMVRKRPS